MRLLMLPVSIVLGLILACIMAVVTFGGVVRIFWTQEWK